MNIYETTATVDDHGQVRLSGVPFESGTVVEITISPKPRATSGPTHPPTTDMSGALCWEGNVLVHRGVGIGHAVAELREDRLNDLSNGKVE